MSDRLIPRQDSAFAGKLRVFARSAAAEPKRFSMSAAEAAALVAAADRFEQAIQKAYGAARSQVTTLVKNEARAEAERLYSRFARRIRASDEIDAATRLNLGLPVRSEKRRMRSVPQEPPMLRFVQSLHVGAGAAPIHELTFCAADRFNASRRPGSKPAGAARLELFVDLIGPEEPVPSYPGANDGGRPWYLRSFSRSPIRITPPMSRVPMMVVYWGRWADATGNVGPWSKTVQSRIEGWSQVMLSTMPAMRKARQIMDEPSAAGRESKYSVVVLDAQVRSLDAPEAPVTQHQLEGPAESEAA